MITDDERFKRIQGILAMSDIHFEDCTKITDLIIDLSHEKNKIQKNWEELKNLIAYRINYLIDCDKELRLANFEKEIRTLKDVLKQMQELEQGKDE